MTNRDISNQSFTKAQLFIPGGVNSPVRAFKAVGGAPIFMQSAKGAYLTDVDGNQYIDLINSWGPMILGHAHEEIVDAVKKACEQSLSFGAPTIAEIEMAELICQLVPSIEKVRMVNSGTEATMSAIRVARAYSQRDKIIKFEGCYHGHGDSFLIAAGSGAMTMGEPDSPGVTKGTANDTITVPFNDLNTLKKVIESKPNEIAAIIIEPVVGNMGCVLPSEGYLAGIRSLCDQYKIVFIFDEVMTGFRLSIGGAQELFNVKPDLTTLGKIIGGGMPVGAYGGKAEIMDMVSPKGPVYQAGTLAGNPVAMAAGLAMLNQLKNNPVIYKELNDITTYIVDGIKENLNRLSLNLTINHVGSMFSLFFTDENVFDLDSAKKSDINKFGQYFNAMLDKGIYLPPAQYETLFISTSIQRVEADRIIQANFDSLKEVYHI